MGNRVEVERCLDLLDERIELGKHGIYFDVEDLEEFFEVVKDYIGSDYVYNSLLDYIDRNEAISPFETVRICKLIREDIRKTHMIFD